METKRKTMKITPKDIATVEQLHDMLLDRNTIVLRSELSEYARDLIKRMYNQIKEDEKQEELNAFMDKKKYLENKYKIDITLIIE